MRHNSMVAKIALLLALVLLVPVARAQAQDEVVQVLNWWPENPTTSFFPGKTASCVLGVRNVGVAPLNVTYALAHLASPYNASINIFNFTGSYLGDVPLAPGEETSAEYAIFFPKQLPPREFVLQVSLVYSAGGTYQQKMFYNETISIVEEPTLFDTQLIGLYLIGLATLAGVVYMFAEFARGKGWIKKSKPAARPAAVSSNKEEWLRGTAADPRLRKKQ